MSIHAKKAAIGSAWVVALGALALSDAVTAAGASRALLVGFGLVPIAVMWAFWNPPQASLSESIRRAQQD